MPIIPNKNNERFICKNELKLRSKLKIEHYVYQNHGYGQINVRPNKDVRAKA